MDSSSTAQLQADLAAFIILNLLLLPYFNPALMRRYENFDETRPESAGDFLC